MAKSLLIIILISVVVLCQPYPDQHYFYEKEDLMQRIDSLNNIEISSDGKRVVLSDGALNGFVIFEPDSSQFPFNRGLPSWNGYVPNDYSSFKVMMRFYKNGWSSWLTVGFWKANIWTTYGSTTYSGGEIDIDYAVLNSYHTKWQFRVDMKRTSTSQPSPDLYKLSFFVSDQVTTNNVNIPALVSDNPEPIFIDTEHFYQYALDPVIGGSICSPTSVSMVIRSYDIEVDPLQFAIDTKCPYWNIFGVWPRVVQNAAEFGLDGMVTRYRSWSDAREVLASGGRVVMSVGYPLYPNGHLIMLAGFDAAGNPISHDPAKSNGYSYIHNKTSLSQSWFNKGGIAYTFFPGDTTNITSAEEFISMLPDSPVLFNNYPNPFNPSTTIGFNIPEKGFVSLKVYDLLGREIAELVNEEKPAGIHEVIFDADELSSGVYVCSINFKSSESPEIYRMNRKMLYLK